jgi:hypothetical protein
MIPVNSIQKVFAELSDALDITIVRSDQRGLETDGKLPYPFASYKILADTNEASISHITSTGVYTQDDHITLVSTYKTANILVSVTFYDKEDIASIFEYAQDCIDWLQGLDGQDILYRYKFALTSQQINVEDRTVFLDTFYETKVGFDLHFIYTYKKQEEIHRIETVEITPEVDDIEEATLVYDNLN